MAKGDHSRMQNQVNYQTGLAQNNLNNLRTNVTRQNQGMENRFNTAADQGQQDYGSIMGSANGQYNNILNSPMHNFGAYGGYQNFADTGGYSPEDIAAIRARSIAPLRATYANANADVDRQRSLQGGYAPNYIAAKAKMARDLSSNLADANTNVEASLADQIRQGKLAGLGGMTGIDSALLGAQTQRFGLGNDAISNLTRLYGTAPGAAQLYGNLLDNSTRNTLGVEGLQGDVMRNNLMGQNMVSGTPGNWQSAMGNIGSTVGLVGDIANIFNPMSFLSGGGKPSTDLSVNPYGPGY